MDDNEDDVRLPPKHYPNYNSSLRPRRPPVRNHGYHVNAGFNDAGIEAGKPEMGYHHRRDVDDDEDEDEEEEEQEDDDDDEEEEYQNGYYRVSGESSRHQKKRRLDTLAANYEFAPRTNVNAPEGFYGGGGGSEKSSADWGENATFALLEVWGDRFVELGRKSLRSDDWVEVAEKVSEMCKTEINDTQCRNQLEMLKKKYKKERAKMEEMGMVGGYHGKWVFFKKMDMLLSLKKPYSGLPCGVDSGEYVFMNPRVYLNRSNALDEMRDSPGESESDGDDDSDDRKDDEGFRLLAESVQNFGEIYEKIETNKRQRMMELEKMRMDFQKELELQKKQILERAQAEIAKIRQGDGDDTDVSAENLSG